MSRKKSTYSDLFLLHLKFYKMNYFIQANACSYQQKNFIKFLFLKIILSLKNYYFKTKTDLSLSGISDSERSVKLKTIDSYYDKYNVIIIKKLFYINRCSYRIKCVEVAPTEHLNCASCTNIAELCTKSNCSFIIHFSDSFGCGEIK